jgi:release factor glutamine methyltransferase
LMHVLGRDRTWLYSYPEEVLAGAAAAEYFALIARRADGEPTQYLTGKQEFWGLEFEVTPAVLIPRPETEHLIEVALDRLGAGSRPANAVGEAPLRIADVGTGSGCIAVALARELPRARIFATDISEAALEVARRNAARHGVEGRIEFLNGDLLEPVARRAFVTDSSAVTEPAPLFDLIVSNPPYIGHREAQGLAREVRDHEPHDALFGGATGLEIYSRLIDQAAPLVRLGGTIVFELGYSSAENVRATFERDVRWSNVLITLDLAGIERVLAARRS